MHLSFFLIHEVHVNSILKLVLTSHRTPNLHYKHPAINGSTNWGENIAVCTDSQTNQANERRTHHHAVHTVTTGR
jgi:hypothetical protein